MTKHHRGRKLKVNKQAHAFPQQVQNGRITLTKTVNYSWPTKEINLVKLCKNVMEL